MNQGEDWPQEILRVKPGTRFQLAGVDPSATHGREKAASEQQLARDLGTASTTSRNASGRTTSHKVLVVLQGIDCRREGRRDRACHGGFNPQGCRCRRSRCRPTANSPTTISGGSTRTPGQAARSRSSTAATTRTCSSCASTTRARRATGRSATTRSTTSSGMLAEKGTTILKFFLHISRDEQRERLKARFETPPSAGSSRRRPRGAQALGRLHRAYEDALSQAPRTGRPGTSSRPTRSGSATSPWPRSSPTPSRRSIRATRRRERIFGGRGHRVGHLGSGADEPAHHAPPAGRPCLVRVAMTGRRWGRA